MGNFPSRETNQLLGEEFLKNFATELKDLIHHSGEHERNRAVESHERHRRRRENTRQRASQIPRRQYHHIHDLYHHQAEPSRTRASPRGGGFYPQRYQEGTPIQFQVEHTGPRHRSAHQDCYNGDYPPFYPQEDQPPNGHHHQSHRQHGQRSHSRRPDRDNTYHEDQYPQAAGVWSSGRYPEYSSSRPQHPRPDLPGYGDERGDGSRGQPRTRRSQQPMQPKQSQRPAATGPPKRRRPPMEMGPYPQDHPTYMNGGFPVGGDDAAFDDEDDEGDDEDREDGMDGPGVGVSGVGGVGGVGGGGGGGGGGGLGGGGASDMVGGGVTGVEGGMGEYRDEYEARRRGG